MEFAKPQTIKQVLLVKLLGIVQLDNIVICEQRNVSYSNLLDNYALLKFSALMALYVILTQQLVFKLARKNLQFQMELEFLVISFLETIFLARVVTIFK